jgi:UDP-N-acetylmuramate--alanine ligase
VVAAFQPHLYSRTAALWREFGAALATADLSVVLDVYRARERAEDHPGVTGRLIAQAAADAAGGRPVGWLPSIDNAERFLHAELRDGDLCLTMGAGNIDELAMRLVKSEAKPRGYDRQDAGRGSRERRPDEGAG